MTDTLTLPDQVPDPAGSGDWRIDRYYLNMRRCTAHVRGHCTHRGAARRSSSLSRYPCQDSAAEIELDLSRSRSRSVEPHSGRGRHRTTVSRWQQQRPAGLGSPSLPWNRRETGSLRRPVHTTRFALAIFRYLQAIWNVRGRGAEQQCSSRAHVRGCCGDPTIAARIFRIRSLHVHPPRGSSHRPMAGRGRPAPTCRRCGALWPCRSLMRPPPPPFYPVRRRRRRAATGHGDGNDSDRCLLPAAGRAGLITHRKTVYVRGTAQRAWD